MHSSSIRAKCERKLDEQIFLNSRRLPSWIINISITRLAKLLDAHLLDNREKKRNVLITLLRLNFIYIIMLHIYSNPQSIHVYEFFIFHELRLKN